jgi:hypothetical protein
MPRSNLYSWLGIPSASSPTPTTFDAPHKYVTSPIPFLRSPLVLASARMLIAVYILATLLTTLIRRSVVDHVGRRYVMDFRFVSTAIPF